MGNQESAQFPYKPQEEDPSLARLTGGLWRLSHGVQKDGTLLSIFSFDKQNQPQYRIDLARNCMRNMKLIRHTHVLKFIDGAELATHIHIVTERASSAPLYQFADNPTKESGMLLSLGLHQILTGIAWLNNDCEMLLHLRPASVFQTETGDWKLGLLDLLHKHNADNRIPQLLKDNLDQVPVEYQSPELQQRKWSLLESTPAALAEAWGVGCLLHALFNGPLRGGPETLSKPGRIPKSLQLLYTGLLKSAAANRTNPGELLGPDCKFMQNPLVRSVGFLENMALASQRDKEIFFEKFGEHLEQFPAVTMRRKLLPQLIQVLEFGGGSAVGSILSSLLRMAKHLQLGTAEFSERLLPALVRMFSSKQRLVRVHLLQQLPEYAEHLTAKLVEKDIFPHVVTGFQDSTPALRELTVKSMVHLAPLLSPATQEGILLKHLSRAGADPEASIRTNTVYCLAKIARHLPEKLRERTLIPAFAAAAKDAFGPARVSAASCIGACAQYLSVPLLARRAIPCLGVLLVDGDASVRRAALQSMDTVMARVRLWVETSSALTEGPGSAASSSSSPPPAGVDSSVAGHTVAALGSAMSSLGSSLWGSGGGGGSPPPPGGGTPQSLGTASVSPPAGRRPPRPPSAAAPAPGPAVTVGSRASAQPPKPSRRSVVEADEPEDDGFGRDDDDDVFAGIQLVGDNGSHASQQRGGDGHDDDDGWAWGDEGASKAAPGKPRQTILELAEDPWGSSEDSPTWQSAEPAAKARSKMSAAELSAWESDELVMPEPSANVAAAQPAAARKPSALRTAPADDGGDDGDVWGLGSGLALASSARKPGSGAAGATRLPLPAPSSAGARKPKAAAAAAGKPQQLRQPAAASKPKAVDMDDWSTFLND